MSEEISETTAEELDKTLSPHDTGSIEEMAESLKESVPVEKPETSESEPSGEPSSLSEKTISVAEEMGLDVGSMDPEAVQGIVDRAEKRAFDQFTKLMGQQQQQQQLPPQQPEPQEPPHWQQQQQQQQQQQPDQGQPSPGIDPFKVDLDPDEYGEDVVGIFNKLSDHLGKMQEHYQSRIDSLDQMIQGQAIEAQQEQFDSMSAWFDEKVSELDDAVYGEGRIEDLNPAGPEFQARQQMFEKYLSALSFEGESDSFSQNDDVLSRLFRWEGLASKSEVNDQRRLSEKIQERSNRTIGKPSGRKSSSRIDDSDIDPQSGFPSAMIDNLNRRLRDAQTS